MNDMQKFQQNFDYTVIVNGTYLNREQFEK